MTKKNIIIGTISALSFVALVFVTSNVFAAGHGMGMMNHSEADFQKMSEAHNLMAQGKYDEAKKIMQDMGMGSCPMMNGNGQGMMNGRDMMNNS